jgi:hypothetical protein
VTGSVVLPRSLAPLPDESVSGYLLRLAHRLDMSPTRLLVVTGLQTPADASHQQLAARIGLVTHAEPATLTRFAHATRLSEDEARGLFLSGYAERYPPAAPRPDPTGRRGINLHLGRWLFAKSTRYCPDCLAGDGSEVQRRHGGPWRRAWRLPVVVACPIHRRYLQHRCPACRRPAHGREHGFLPRWWDQTLHPTQCRATIDPPGRRRRGERPACAQWLSRAPAAASPPAQILALQQRIVHALDPATDGVIETLGRPAAAGGYFTDLMQLAYLIRRSWPLGRDLVPTGGLADELDHHLAEQHRQITDRCRDTGADAGRLMQNQHRSAPVEAVPCAALLAAVDQLLTLDSPRELTGHLRRLLTHDQRRPGRADWTRRFLDQRPDSCEGLRQAIAPILQTHARDRRARALHAPIRRTRFGPEHIAQFLQTDWYQRHLAHFEGINPTHLRRAAALHLVQIAAGGTIAQALVRLGLPDNSATHDRCCSSVKAVRRWTRQRADPHQFEAALHDLADHLEASTHRVDYHRRRSALRNWCIDAAAWRKIVAQLPEWADGGRPELGDRKRQSASIIVWARVTGSEHVFAPHPIRDRQPEHLHHLWRLSGYAMFARFRDLGPTRRHDKALDRLLTQYSNQLAADIDNPPRRWAAR